MKRSILFVLMALCTTAMFAQTITVKGTVIGAEDSQPVIGAYVLQEGTNNGTSTDLDGNYVLSVPKDAKLVFSSVGEYGLEIFTDYGKVLAVLVGCMILMALVIDPLSVALALKKNPYPLVFKCFKESGVTAFFTRSSAANIPVNMNLCEKLGLDKEYYSVSIPLGATINMDGAAITITVMSLAAAFSQGIEVNIFLAILLSFVATLGACGASGVAGGSLLLIPMACSLLGVGQDIAMQVVGVGFIIGVIQDSLETAINSSGDVIFCATAEFREWQKQGKELPF